MRGIGNVHTNKKPLQIQSVVLLSIYSVVIPIHLNREMTSSFSYSSLTTDPKYTVSPWSSLWSIVHDNAGKLGYN